MFYSFNGKISHFVVKRKFEAVVKILLTWILKICTTRLKT
jgi:hypothetical protein